MVMMWAWGTVSPQMVQHIMQLFCKDLEAASGAGLSMEMVNFLAEIGSSGDHPNNMNRDLMMNLGKHPMPRLHNFSVPLKHSALAVVNQHMR